MQEILQVLSHLDEDAQRRVTSWVSERIARVGGVDPQEAPDPQLDRDFPKARAFIDVKTPRTKLERLVCLAYSNAIAFERPSLPSNAQIRAQTRLVDRHAPSSQRGSGVRAPSIHDD